MVKPTFTGRRSKEEREALAKEQKEREALRNAERDAALKRKEDQEVRKMKREAKQALRARGGYSGAVSGPFSLGSSREGTFKIKPRVYGANCQQQTGKITQIAALRALVLDQARGQYGSSMTVMVMQAQASVRAEVVHRSKEKTVATSPPLPKTMLNFRAKTLTSLKSPPTKTMLLLTLLPSSAHRGLRYLFASAEKNIKSAHLVSTRTQAQRPQRSYWNKRRQLVKL